jgi:iduronate 2-sulfatase
MGEHGLWQKLSLFEESSRVPLFMIVPGKTKKASIAKTPVSHVDIYPTLAELCGVKTPANLQGQSLVPILTNPNAAGRGWALTQVSRKEARKGGKAFFGYTLRTQRWRYTEWDEGKQGRELYDHDADPREIANLAGVAARAATVKELSAQLRAAVAGTFPPSGETPALREGLWAPDLTKP